MKPVVFVIVSTFLYALANLILEQKLAKLSTAAVLLIVYPAMFALLMIWICQIKMSGESFTAPSGYLLFFAVLAGVIWFCADYFFVGAYMAGGSMLTITTIFSLFPVAAAILRALYTGAMPTKFHMIAYVLAIGAAYFAARGESIIRSS